MSEQRDEPDPDLVPTQSAELRAHANVPEDKYEMAGGCYALQSTTNDKWVVRSGTGYAATAADAAGAEPFHFQATDLGSYLLWDNDKEFVGLPACRRRLDGRAGQVHRLHRDDVRVGGHVPTAEPQSRGRGQRDVQTGLGECRHPVRAPV